MHDQARIWFVTGAAHGLGRVLARAALRRGDIVVGTSADGELAFDDGFRSARLAGDFHPIEMTPTAAGSVRAALAKAQALHGRIDVIVIHAEDPPPGRTEAAHWFDLHFLGPMRVMQAALPILRAQGHGRIVDVSSRTLAPRAGWDVYAVAANALQHSSQSLADELRQLGIEVVRVEPDAVDADTADRAFAVALEKALKACKPPSGIGAAPRHLDVFRDESDFTGTEYFAAIETH